MEDWALIRRLVAAAATMPAVQLGSDLSIPLAALAVIGRASYMA